MLVLGGARSGKSSFAEQIVTSLGGADVTYVATAQVKDQEMERRVAEHRSSRPEAWATIEEPKNVSQALADLPKDSVVLLDCLTVLVSNLLLQEEELTADDYDFAAADREQEIREEIQRIIARAEENNLSLVVVSNEVGKGLVPPYKAGRVYRDIVGRANKLVAEKADEVYITYAGLPVEIKELGKKTKAKFKIQT